MSLADDFLRDAGIAQSSGSIADQFSADLQGAPAVQQARKSLQPPEKLSLLDRALAMVPTGLVNNPEMDRARRFVGGAAKLPLGGVQLAANVLPDSTGIPQAVNQAISDKYHSMPAKPAGDFFDRMTVGAVASPVNLLTAGAAGPAVGVLGRAAMGAKLGGLNAGLTPVDTESTGGKYWAPKAIQTGVGAAAGAVLSPIAGALGDKVASAVTRLGLKPEQAGKNADAVIAKVLEDSGQKMDDLPPDMLASLRTQVQQALTQGKNLDTAAALRKADFDKAGIKPTLGWITRNPKQWAEEQNVRGVTGVGEPVTERIATGNAQLTQGITSFGRGSEEAASASQKLAAALRGYDESQRQGVTAAYNTARQAVGKDLDVPLQGLAQDYASVLDRFGNKVPSALQKKFAAMGLDPAAPANQKRVFSIEDANKLLEDINAHYGVDKPTNTALGQLNAAVKKAVTDVDAGGGPFAPAVKAARDRFQQLDAIPALKAASDGRVDDTFVQKYVVASKDTEQVKRLAALLKEKAPEAYEEARAQIGATLSRAAFGENASADKMMAQESYNKALRTIGTEKLQAFFSPEEVEKMKLLGRVGSYMGSPPAGSASNYSNTASALANLLRKGAKIPVAGQSLKYGGDYLVAKNALDANVPVTPNISPTQRAAIAKALAAMSGSAGLGLASQLQ